MSVSANADLRNQCSAMILFPQPTPQPVQREGNQPALSFMGFGAAILRPDALMGAQIAEGGFRSALAIPQIRIQPLI
ncbi:MAG TPA: hypothetical protein VEI03_01510 [Stellaceae bacterium]|nr:hypothetical protein [Stellaceae bacterium]